jgi:hypothetical protein
MNRLLTAHPTNCKKAKDLWSWVRMDLLRNLGLHLGAEIGFVDVQHIACRRWHIENPSNLRDEGRTRRPSPFGSKREQPDLSGPLNHGTSRSRHVLNRLRRREVLETQKQDALRQGRELLHSKLARAEEANR